MGIGVGVGGTGVIVGVFVGIGGPVVFVADGITVDCAGDDVHAVKRIVSTMREIIFFIFSSPF